MQQYRPSGFSMLPMVVKNLLIINGLFFLATIALNSSLQIDLVKYLGLHYPLSKDFGVWQFISYMFMHSAYTIDPQTQEMSIYFWHILFNMFALWMFGNTLENVWGPKRFLNYYLITGVGAAVIQIFVVWVRISYLESSLSPDQILFIINGAQGELAQGVNNETLKTMQELYSAINKPTVGASGAVFGILLAFGMMFPNALIYVYFAIPIKAKYFVMIYAAIELSMGISNNAGDNVAHFAHLGGMIFGFFLIMYWKKKGKLNSY